MFEWFSRLIEEAFVSGIRRGCQRLNAEAATVKEQPLAFDATALPPPVEEEPVANGRARKRQTA
jgi:hypothetical protein